MLRGDVIDDWMTQQYCWSLRFHAVLFDEDQTRRKDVEIGAVTSEVRTRTTEEYKSSACENVKSDWKILYAICDSER